MGRWSFGENMKKIAFLFPGQGAQYVGMGKAFYDQVPEAKAVFDRADELLRYSLTEIIFDGPSEKLTETKHAQTAIFVVSQALLAALQQHVPGVKPTFVAGLSLGEYSALCAAQALSFDDALTLVSTRARLMHQACEETKGSMAVILGMEDNAVEEVVKEVGAGVWMANLNCPGQVAISGTLAGIEAASALAKERGAKRVIPLDVHGAFHSGLMQSAENHLEPHLDKLTLLPPSCPIVMNVTGEKTDQPDQIRANLKHQVTAPVYWKKGIEAMDRSQVELYIEIGCAKVLSGLNRRIGVIGTSLNIEVPEDLEKLQGAVKL